MTVTDRIFQNVAELSVPNFFITVEFSVMGNEMPEHIESFVLEKYQAILHGANGRKFVYTEGGWRLFFTFFPTDKVVDERYGSRGGSLFPAFFQIRGVQYLSPDAFIN